MGKGVKARRWLLCFGKRIPPIYVILVKHMLKVKLSNSNPTILPSSPCALICILRSYSEGSLSYSEATDKEIN